MSHPPTVVAGHLKAAGFFWRDASIGRGKEGWSMVEVARVFPRKLILKGGWGWCFLGGGDQKTSSLEVALAGVRAWKNRPALDDSGCFSN